MSRLTARIRIVRLLGGRYKVEKIRVNEDRGDRVDVFKVPVKEAEEFVSKGEAREHGVRLAHAFIVDRYAEGTKYSVEYKTRVEIPPEVGEQFMAS